MGGMIFCSGPDSFDHYEKVKDCFINLKDLPISYERTDHSHQLIKFRRMYEQGDSNIYLSNTVIVFAVGTICYREGDSGNAVREIALGYESGLKPSKIAHECDGHFCLLIFSEKDSTVYIITDACGSLHAYLYQNESLFVVSTSLLSMAKHFRVTPNIESVKHFIGISHCLEGMTLFDEIHTLEPASIYEVNLATSSIERTSYWGPPKSSNYDISFEQAVQGIRGKLERVIKALPNEDAVYDFTGGYDSRLVLAIVYGLSGSFRPLFAYFFGPLRSREAIIVEDNCRNLGIRYINNELPETWEDQFFDYVLRSQRLCDGMEDACNYAPILWALERKRKQFRLSVNGLAGELYRQKEWEYDFGRRGQKRPANLTRKIRMELFGADFTLSIFSGAFRKSMEMLPSELEIIYSRTNDILHPEAPNTLHYDNLYFQHRLRFCHGRNLSTSNQIIQTASPLWFRRPLELSMQLPYYYKLKAKLTRTIAEKASVEFAGQKMINDTPFVPMRLSNLHRFFPGIQFVFKKGVRKFSQLFFKRTILAGLTMPDYDNGLWFQRALEDPRCRELVNYDHMVTAPLYDRHGLNEFVNLAHKGKGFHFYGQLGNIITLELTMRFANIPGFNVE